MPAPPDAGAHSPSRPHAVGGGAVLLAGVGYWLWRSRRRGARTSVVHGYEEPAEGMA